MANKYVLVVNPGSSSREYAIYQDTNLVVGAYYEHDAGKIICNVNTGNNSSSKPVNVDLEDALSHFLDIVEANHDVKRSNVALCGIRVVAPGRYFLQHRIINDKVVEHMRHHQDRAPLHIANALKEINQAQSQLQHAKLCAISDSEFHKTLLHESRNYAIPRSDADELDIYRFGYHGLSVQSVVHQLTELSKLPERLVVCHLGSGASITAVKKGQSVETSMGYSPLEGLIMATRSGSIDVAAAIQIKKQKGMDDEQLLNYLNKQSGLLGLSGLSNDIRVLLNEEERNPDSKFALSAMIYRLQSYIGAYQAVLGGLDAIVFTATAGERSDVIRERVCEKLQPLGVELDHVKNKPVKESFTDLSSPNASINTYVVVSDELGQLARESLKLM